MSRIPKSFLRAVFLLVMGFLGYFAVDQAPSTQRSTPAPTTVAVEAPATAPAVLPESGTYSDKQNVALYIYTYGHLPTNYITKSEARSLGWTGGPLESVAPGKSIGGDHYGNYERRLPPASYRECDVDSPKHSRGPRRLIYSTSRAVFYTPDHYESFEQLY